MKVEKPKTVIEGNEFEKLKNEPAPAQRLVKRRFGPDRARRVKVMVTALGPVDLLPTTLYLSVVQLALVGELQAAVGDGLAKLWVH